MLSYAVQMCSNVVAPGSVIDVFEMLVSSAATTVDEERGNPSWQPRADFYVSCILGSLPWGGLELAEVNILFISRQSHRCFLTFVHSFLYKKYIFISIELLLSSSNLLTACARGGRAGSPRC